MFRHSRALEIETKAAEENPIRGSESLKWQFLDQVLIHVINNPGGMFAGLNNDIRNKADVYVKQVFELSKL
jgi:hypothetical protein